MSPPAGHLGVLLLNFGEPADPDADSVERYLERIFLQNAALGTEEGDAARRRARELARARTPALVEDYRAIGGSPLNRQADAQAAALGAELRARGWNVSTYSAFQFTPPSITERVAEARAAGVETLVALPCYPLCGRSTNVAALEETAAALEDQDWQPRFLGLTGWHHDPAYVELRVDTVRAFAEAQGLDLSAPDTILYFSAHGTPLRYLEEGSRYDRYVDEHCRAVAHGLGVERYAVGFQNHSNRPIAWTRPDNDDLLPELRERRIVVVPISFMHEQSETLAELDVELRELAESLGKEMHRVPVPHDDPRFARLLAGLVGQVVEGPAGSAPESTAGSACGGSAGSAAGSSVELPEEERPGDAPSTLARCRCAGSPVAWCTNGARDLPPSPYGRPPGAR